MRNEGYVFDIFCVFYNFNEEEKESLFCGYSEKLVIVFGILNIFFGRIIRVVKNFRVCNDCYIVIKFIFKIEKREIIFRDVRRFYYFKDGICFCGDYW